MQTIDWSHLGKMPFTQDRGYFLQNSFLEPFAAIAKLCGNKTILYGVEELVPGTITDGWISVDGELLKFIGGAVGTDVVIDTAYTDFVYKDATVHHVYSVKTATCGAVGAFPFTDLQPLLALEHVWKKDDIRQCVKDAAYELINFDSNGYGITPEEKGWRILSKAFANAEGAVLVNKKPGDPEFGLVSNYGGEKTHTLTIPEMPAHNHGFKHNPDRGGNSFGNVWMKNDGGSATKNTENTGGGGAHNNLQPYFVVLTLIKL